MTVVLFRRRCLEGAQCHIVRLDVVSLELGCGSKIDVDDPCPYWFICVVCQVISKGETVREIVKYIRNIASFHAPKCP